MRSKGKTKSFHRFFGYDVTKPTAKSSFVVPNTSSMNLSEESVIGHLNFEVKESKVDLSFINIEDYKYE